ncbi:MAG: hypothetical protein Ct9H300mP23_02820 [Nitrospinota bacterium]|nr:MAG: hypothetical protein Ct9H300mP23_02820 [Nitrospinota bacterium]
MCPTCYVGEKFGKANDTKSPMPVIVKPPISLSRVEVNAVIAYLQSKGKPGICASDVPFPQDDAEYRWCFVEEDRVEMKSVRYL